MEMQNENHEVTKYAEETYRYLVYRLGNVCMSQLDREELMEECDGQLVLGFVQEANP